MSVKRTLSSLVITKTSNNSNKVFSRLLPLCTLVHPLTGAKVVWEEADIYRLFLIVFSICFGRTCIAFFFVKH